MAQLGETGEHVVVLPNAVDYGIHNLVVRRARDRRRRLGAKPRAWVAVIGDEGAARLAPARPAQALED